MKSDELQQFIRDALGRGLPRERITAALLAAGWRPDVVRDALASYAETDFPVPVPAPRPYASAREAFEYLLLFSLLYLVVWHAGSLLFTLIDVLLPDAAETQPPEDYWRSGLRWSVASLAVVFPLFLWLSRRTGRQLRTEPAHQSSRVRKWLTWTTLFLASLALVGDLVTLLAGLLAGDLGARFLLKCMVVAVLAVLVIGRYLPAVRESPASAGKAPAWREPLSLGASIVLVLLAAGGGLYLAGSPQHERLRRLDAQREGDLQALSAAIRTHWSTQQRLPAALAALESEGILAEDRTDPASGQDYEYRILGDTRYELCAHFALASGRNRGDDFGDAFALHGEGRHCFPQDVDEEALP